MKKRLSHAALYELFRGLALLLHAGIPLADGAYLLAQEASTSRAALLRELDFILTMLKEKGEKATFRYIKEEVLTGKPFPWEETEE